jgi:sec-independent protein translocase protein TatA
LLVLLLVVIVFGVGKLPEVGGALGKSIREFRKANEEVENPPKTTDTVSQDEIDRRVREAEIEREVQRRLAERQSQETARKE